MAKHYRVSIIIIIGIIIYNLLGCSIDANDHNNDVYTMYVPNIGENKEIDIDSHQHHAEEMRLEMLLQQINGIASSEINISQEEEIHINVDIAVESNTELTDEQVELIESIIIGAINGITEESITITIG